MPQDGDITDYEVSLLGAILDCCEKIGEPYIHDEHLVQMNIFGNTVVIKDLIWRLSTKGYVEQNEWEESSAGRRIRRLWWQLTPKAMEVLSNGRPKAPNTISAGRPSWLSKLPDAALQSVLDEVYRARDAGFLMLPLMGARTAFDRAMYLKIGDPKGGFKAKLSEMKKSGLLDERGADILNPMIDAGNAAAHRGWSPTREILNAVIQEVEHQLHDWFFRDDAASLVRGATPQRSGG